jgi:hypothetical protein
MHLSIYTGKFARALLRENIYHINIVSNMKLLGTKMSRTPCNHITYVHKLR